MEFKIMKQGALINISLVITLLGIAVFTGLVVYFLNKGYELSDESYYLLCTKYPYDNKLLVTAYGLISHRLCFGMNDLVSLRVFKLVYQLLFLVIFARAFYLFAIRSIRSNSKNTLLASLMLIVAGFSNYDYLPMTISYNSWSLNFGLLFWAGLLFAHSTVSKRGIALSNILMGMAVALLFYNKAPNSVVMALVFLIFTFIYRKENILSSFLLFGLGKVAAVIILFLSYDTYSEMTKNILYNILHTRQATVGGYFSQLGDLVSNQLGYDFVLAQLFVVALMYFLRKKGVKAYFGIIILLLNTFFTYSHLKGNSSNVANEFIVFCIFGVNCMATLVLFGSREYDLKVLAIPVLLILSPFMLAAGTSNSIFYTSSQLVVFSVAGLFMLLLRLQQKEMELFYAYCGAFICFVIGCFMYHGMIKHPYRQTDLTKKDVNIIPSDQIKGVLEDPDRSMIFNELSVKLNKHNSARLPVLSCPSTLGTLMLTNTKPFAVCWICENDNEALSNDEYFKKLDIRNDKPFLMITKGMFNSKLQNEIFKEGGMDLKMDYAIMDSVYLEWNKEYYYLMQPVKNV